MGKRIKIFHNIEWLENNENIEKHTVGNVILIQKDKSNVTLLNKKVTLCV